MSMIPIDNEQKKRVVCNAVVAKELPVNVLSAISLTLTLEAFTMVLVTRMLVVECSDKGFKHIVPE
jgi:hypothetical protein